MNVACPHCQRRYRLPETLMGPAGARVRCPGCAGAFEVGADGAVTTGAPAGSVPAAAATAAPVAADDSPAGLARRVLEELEREPDRDLAAAAREGRLFSRHGPRLLEAFEAWRRAAGRAADAAAFRDELARRAGLDLSPRSDPPGR